MKLYIKSSQGSIRFWEIESTPFGLETKYGMVGGSVQYKDIPVHENNSGRDFDEQCQLEMDSRIKKRMDQGYCTTMEEARKGKTNALGLPLPMLAQPYKASKVPRGFFIQRKYDGNRCLIVNRDGDIFAYSRNGKRIESIEHILASAENLPVNHVLDGELYHHGTPLQTIRSWISKKQAASNNLVYMCYDMFEIGSKAEFIERLEALELLELGDSIKKAETSFLPSVTALESNSKGVTEYLREYINDGYEGLIIRTTYGEYQDGKRSPNLIKVKSWQDDEFKVVGMTASNDGWAILHCRAKNGRIFKVSCHGDVEYKHQVYRDMDEHIGKFLTVQYANLTKDGVPFHPIAIAFRGAHE